MSGTIIDNPACTVDTENYPPSAGALAASIQKGRVTLVGGTATVAGVRITSTSRIFMERNTTSGTLGNLSAPDASRSASLGQFVINSDQATESSTIDWIIFG